MTTKEKLAQSEKDIHRAIGNFIIELSKELNAKGEQSLCYSDSTKNIMARSIMGRFVNLDKIRATESGKVEVHEMVIDRWFSICLLEAMEIVEINDYIDWKE